MVRDTTPTDYHENPRPEDGADWATDWDAVMAFLETNAPAHGPLTDRPTSAPDEALYLATDEEVLFQYDATAQTWTDLLSNESGGGGSWLGTTATVDTASDLQTAIDNNGLIRIDGVLDLSGEPTITVPNNRVIYGFGNYGYHYTGLPSDVLSDDKADPTLRLDGNGVRLLGFAIRNTNADGIGVLADGYSPNLSNLDVEAGYIGAQMGDPDSSDTQTEPRINFCRFYSYTDSPGDGSIGISVPAMYDSKLHNNITAGFDIGISVTENHATIAGNHTYGYPSSSYTTGIQLGARWLRCLNNRMEDGITGRAIEISNWYGGLVIAHNLIEAQTGANGIEATTTTASFTDLLIAHNHIGVNYDAGPAETAIDLNGAGTEHSYIGQNVIDDYNTYGDVQVTVAPGAGNAPAASDHMPGVTVLNTDDDTLWYHAGDAFIQTGG